MTKKIIALNFNHLTDLIKEHIYQNGHGNECSLNHIDVSNLIEMSHLFSQFPHFNGDISQWNTSRVVDMGGMFAGSHFNGDISKWNTSKVKNMNNMFNHSDFIGDISNWDVSNVTMMSYMFNDSKFNGDISKWQIHDDCILTNMFIDTSFPLKGVLFWYYHLEQYDRETQTFSESLLNEEQLQYFKSNVVILDSFNISGIKAAKYLHNNFSLNKYIDSNFNFQND